MKNTRKHRKSQKRKTQGGSRLEQGPMVFKALGTMIGYGISAIIVGPLYLLAELLNVPMTSFNMLSKKAFDSEKKHSFLHMPIHKLVSGCPIKNLKEDDFVLQKDMYIHSNVAVVSCDGKNESDNQVEDYGTSFADSFMNFFGIMPGRRHLRHYVFRLFNYIDNIRENDEGRKKHIHAIIRNISNLKTLIKCYLIYRTVADKCAKVRQNNPKTVLKDEDVVKIVNPYYLPSDLPYNTRLKCVSKHFTKKAFDQGDSECKPTCDTCTFRNSFSRLTRKYSNMLNSTGCRSSMIKKMIDKYYKYMKIEKPKDLKEPTDEKGFVEYLDKIKVENHLSEAKVDDEELVMKKLDIFMCKYDIVSVVKEQIQKVVKGKLDDGYQMYKLVANIESTSTGMAL